MRDHLDTLRAEAAALAAAARLGLDARVPSCPDWDVAGLLRHTAYGYRWVTKTLTTRATAETPYDPEPATDDDPLAAFEAALTGLLQAFADTTPDTTVWTWFPPDQTVGFWARRMAHETSVHRWDAQYAHGVAAPVETGRAVDGVAEMLGVFLPEHLREHPEDGLSGTFLVRATDTGDTWRGTLRPNGSDVTRDDAPADATVSGTASDLMLRLWGRDRPVTAEGDERITGLLTS